jgi:hypothetical protein
VSDFFGALELELRAAAQRRPRRRISVGTVIGAAAAAALVAVAVVVAAAVSGGGGGDSAKVVAGDAVKPDPVGTVIPAGEGKPPRAKRSVVVATGSTRIAGPWQMEIQRSERLMDDKGELMQPGGLRCVWLYLLDLPDTPEPAGYGYCGPFPRTPGFTRGQVAVPFPRPRPTGEPPSKQQVLIYGRAPERAKYVAVTVPGRVRMRAPVYQGPRGTGEDYYVVAIPTAVGRTARINWLGEDGKPGSRGIPLLPPAIRR